MIVRLITSFIFVLWPFSGLAFGVLDDNWRVLGSFVMFSLVFMVSAVFMFILVSIWRKDNDADKY
jgi:hypothetical protein